MEPERLETSPTSSPDAAEFEPPRVVITRRMRVSSFTSRFVTAHLIAYPLGFSAAVAVIPHVIRRHERDLLAVNAGPKHAIIRDATRNLSASEAGQAEVVILGLLPAVIVVLAWAHLVAIPWCLAAARALGTRGAKRTVQRGLKIYLAGMALAFAATALVGAWGWVWLLTL